MKYALISDIHGNYEALQVVLADIQEQGITRIICLGDIVGYGPNPCECLDAVIRRCDVTILGNHDVYGGAGTFDAFAEEFDWLPTDDSPPGEEGVSYYFDYDKTFVEC